MQNTNTTGTKTRPTPNLEYMENVRKENSSTSYNDEMGDV
jgi:hypothetical protein